ncbi:hypothetical protein LSAT2_031248, partial [Lamellibrachia satsuma]
TTTSTTTPSTTTRSNTTPPTTTKKTTATTATTAPSTTTHSTKPPPESKTMKKTSIITQTATITTITGPSLSPIQTTATSLLHSTTPILPSSTSTTQRTRNESAINKKPSPIQEASETKNATVAAQDSCTMETTFKDDDFPCRKLLHCQEPSDWISLSAEIKAKSYVDRLCAIVVDCENTISISNFDFQAIDGEFDRVVNITISRCNTTQVRLADDMYYVVEVDLNGNGFDSLDFMQEWQSNEFEALHFYNNQIKNVRQKDFSTFNHLSSLILESNLITDVESGSFLNNHELRRLDLANNRLLTLRENMFRELGRLKVVRLAGNRINSMDTAAFVSVHLDSLDLSHNDVTIVPNSAFVDTSVISLNLSNCRITNIPVGFLSSLRQKLTTLDLSNNDIESLPYVAFVHLSHLQVIYLTGNRITAIEQTMFPSTISQIHLTSKNVRCCHLHWLQPLVEVTPSSDYVDCIYPFAARLAQYLKSSFDCAEPEVFPIVTTDLSMTRKKATCVARGVPTPNVTLMTEDGTCVADAVGSKSVPVNLNVSVSLLLPDTDVRKYRKLLHCREPSDWTSLSAEVKRRSQDDRLCAIVVDCANMVSISNFDFQAIGGEFDRVINITISRCNTTHVRLANDMYYVVEVDLNGNSFDTFNFMQDWPKTDIETLHFPNNQIGHVRKKDFSGMVHLNHLRLDSNLITEVEPGSFRDNRRLQTVDLANNRLHTLGETVFRDLNALKMVRLNRNRINSMDPAAFVNAHLDSLDLSHNDITTVSNSAFVNTSVISLNLSNCRITNIPSGFLSSLLQNLTTLDLSNNDIANLTSDAFVHLSQLQVIHLTGNRLTAIEKSMFPPSVSEIHLISKNLRCCGLFWLQTLMKRTPSSDQVECIYPFVARLAQYLESSFACAEPEVFPIVTTDLSETITQATCKVRGVPSPNVTLRTDEGAYVEDAVGSTSVPVNLTVSVSLLLPDTDVRKHRLICIAVNAEGTRQVSLTLPGTDPAATTPTTTAIAAKTTIIAS